MICFKAKTCNTSIIIVNKYNIKYNNNKFNISVKYDKRLKIKAKIIFGDNNHLS